MQMFRLPFGSNATDESPQPSSSCSAKPRPSCVEHRRRNLSTKRKLPLHRHIAKNTRFMNGFVQPASFDSFVVSIAASAKEYSESPSSLSQRYPSISSCFVDDKQISDVLNEYNQPSDSPSQLLNMPIQNVACMEMPDVSPCLDCLRAEADNRSTYCRFRDFRKLQLDDAGHVVSISFCSQWDEDSDATDFKEWLPSADTQIRGQKWDAACSSIILEQIEDYFMRLIQKERMFLDRCLRMNIIRSDSQLLPWKDSDGVRELCDVCATTIFNLHLFCPHCGLCVCQKCFEDRTQLVYREDVNLLEKDSFGWAYCSRQPCQRHFPSEMNLACMIPECDTTILSTLLRLEQLATFYLRQLHANRNIMKSPIGSSAHWYLFDEKLLVLNRPFAESNLEIFQRHWKTSYPIIVQNVHMNMSNELWRPVVFMEKCRYHKSLDSLVDCRLGKIISGLSVDVFWEGFVDCALRPRASDGRKMCLKLKDWPSGDTFSSVLREHYDDICQALPIQEYTHPEHGIYNLATKLPHFCLAPDLGPKLYNAYDMVFEPEKGTTNLHLDISDAVNILVNVTVPSNINPDFLMTAIISYLEEQGLDENDLRRVRMDPSKAGALWTIFRAEDNHAIREFLRDLAEEKQGDINDPIHDQNIYLNCALRKRLEEERGVKGFNFVQMLGDAVFIPAGAAHQVQNLLCCIKIAEDFVSPEGVRQCAIITDEIRSLTSDHNNHEDKLQLSNIVTHSVREAVLALNDITK